MPNMSDDLNDCGAADEDEKLIWDVSEMTIWPDGTNSAYWIFFDSSNDELDITETTHYCELCGKYFKSFTAFYRHRGIGECMENDNAQ